MMLPEGSLLALIALVATVLLTGLVRRLAVSWSIVDIPNERSSHRFATPRGGGLAIVVTFSAALLYLCATERISQQLFWALAPGGAAVAAVGFLDDRTRLAPSVRLTVHVLAAAWAVYWLGGLSMVQVGEHVHRLHWMSGTVLAILGIGWTLNLFNFMDGIDGLAASEALFIAATGALLAASSGNAGLATCAWVFAFACAGFLGWNWAPARVFLGDVGSGYVGFVIAVLALADSTHAPAAVWIWLILGGAFFVDASVTLVRRALRREPLHEAHRQHAYQRLARQWSSHPRVTLAVIAVNLLWLLPWALFASRHQQFAFPVALLCLLPLLLVVALAGAGRATG